MKWEDVIIIICVLFVVLFEVACLLSFAVA